MQRELIHLNQQQNLTQSEIEKLDIDKLKSLPTNINNLKSKVDKLDTAKLETTPADSSKLINVVKK